MFGILAWITFGWFLKQTKAISEEPKVYFISTNNRVIEKEALYISCISSGNPVPTIEWHLNRMVIITVSENLKESLIEGYHNTFLSVTFKRENYTKSTLVFKHVTEENNNSILTCEAKNSLGSSSQTTKIEVLPRKAKTSHLFPGPVLKDSEAISLKRENSPVVLKCLYNSSMRATVYWYRNYEFIREQDVNINNHNDYSLWKIPRMTKQDEGTYRCFVFNSYGGRLSKPVILKISDLPTNPTNVTVSSVSSTTATICWVNPNSNIVIENYTIIYQPVDRKQNFLTFTNPKTLLGRKCHNLSNLRPHTKYLVWMILTNALGSSKKNNPIGFLTSEDVPSDPPNSITASAISNTAVDIRWKKVDNINGFFKEYLMIYTEHPDLSYQHWKPVRTMDESAFLSHLSSNKVIYIKIQVINSIGKGPLSKTVAILTKSGTLSECPDFKASLVLLTQLKVEWGNPDPSNSLGNQGFQIEIFVVTDRDKQLKRLVKLNRNTFSFEMDNFEQNQLYEFILRAFNTVGLGMPVSLEVKTAGKAIENLDVLQIRDVTAFTIFLSWRSPKRNAFNITLHLFRLFESAQKPNQSFVRKSTTLDDENSFTTWIPFMFGKLFPNTKYSLRLTFLMLENSSTIRESYFDSQIIQTKESEQDSVGYFNVKLTEKADIPKVLTDWEQLPNFENPNESIFYRLQFKVIFPKELESNYYSVITNASSYDIELKDDPAYGVAYEFKLSRLDSHNPKREAIKTVTLPEEKPSRPPRDIKIRNMTSNSISIQWKDPDPRYRNGKIISYEIELKAIIPDKIVEVKNVTSNNALLSGLQTQKYSIRIRGYTSKGYGPWTDYFYFTFSPVDIRPPQHVKALRISDTKIKVNWKMPQSKEFQPYEFLKNLFGFVIYYATKETPNITTEWASEKFFEEVYSHEIKNLKTSNDYFVRMSSIDQYYRIGEWSEPIVPKRVATSSYEERIIKNFKCCSVLERSMEVCGEYPKNSEALEKITISYTGRNVHWSAENSQKLEMKKETSVSTAYSSKSSEFSEILQPLDPFTKYTIQATPVYSKSSELNSNYILSTTIQCETSVAAPFEIRQPEFILDEKAKQILRLYRCSEKNGNIKYYHLIITPYKEVNSVVLPSFVDDPNALTIMELSTKLNAKDSKSPVIVFSQPTFDLFKGNLFNDFVIANSMVTRHYANEANDILLYRSALRACVEANDGRPLCNTSAWSDPFLISDKDTKDPSSRPTMQSPNKESTVKYENQTVITLSITLSGILIAILSIITGCVVHKRKNLKKKWNFHHPINSPEILQDAQFTPLMAVNCSKLERLMPDTNHTGCNSSPSTNQKSLHAVCLNYNSFPSYDSPIVKKRTEETPDLVNIKDNPLYSLSNSFQPIAKSLSRVIPVSFLLTYIDELKAFGGRKLTEEFEALNKACNERFTADISNLPENKLRNRYANVVAYDHSLVVLQSQFDDETKYINANFIDGYKKENEYIATQGPLQETVDDFWQMVWEQQTTVVVMLLKVEESEAKKCEIYWPKKGSRNYRALEVTLLNQIYKAYYVVRKFQLRENGNSERREVYHLQFTSWPDQGVPLLLDPFISFIKLYQTLKLNDRGPTIVHCSAGVGRTGVFIVIDTQMQKIRAEKVANVFDTVVQIRRQRNYMVQTEAQYELIFEVLSEWIQDTFPELTPEKFINYIKQLAKSESHSLTGFEAEFQTITARVTTSAASFPQTYGNSDINKPKNKSPHLLPFDWNRVNLSTISQTEGSDYVNASFIDSYLETKAFIVTQSPLATTVEDFWRLIWDHKCSIVVALGKVKEFIKDNLSPYWPMKKSIRYQFFVVDPMVEYDMSHYVMREFKVTDARDGEYRTIRQFHYSNWLDNGCPNDCNSFLEFIYQIQVTKENFGHGKPLLVHCSYGTGKSGIFITLNNILEKYKYENIYDVFHNVKLLLYQRVCLVQTVDQYKFCYLAALAHIIQCNPKQDFQQLLTSIKQAL